MSTMPLKNPCSLFFLAATQSITLIALSQHPGYSSERLQKLLAQPSANVPAKQPLENLPAKQPLQSSSNSAQKQSSSLLASPDQLTQLQQIFSDVNSSQWAYESIESLAIRFGCLSGYPDKTFRGEQALKRDEFAAGLNHCLERIDALMKERTQNLVTKEQLATLFQVLSNIFQQNPELRKVPGLENNPTSVPSNGSLKLPSEPTPSLPPLTNPSKQQK